MSIKQIRRRILGGCLACLLCFTGSIPAFAAGTATPANADERRENPPGLENKASGALDSGTLETPEEIPLVLVTEIQNEGELRLQRELLSLKSQFLFLYRLRAAQTSTASWFAEEAFIFPGLHLRGIWTRSVYGCPKTTVHGTVWKVAFMWVRKCSRLPPIC